MPNRLPIFRRQLSWFFCFPLLLWSAAGFLSPVQAEDRPNFVLILIDDLGWSDLGCYGNDFVETPRIDQLAAEGLRFTDFYAAGAVCSPTRCALQSGQNQARVGITDFIPGHWRPFENVVTPRPRSALPSEIVTIGETLQEAGYATGYIGKWHLGTGRQFQPDRQGYGFSAVINGPHLPGRFRVVGRSDLLPSPERYRTEYEADLSIAFIREHRDEPFFLMLSPYAVHIPLAAMSEKVDRYRSKAKEQGRDLPHPIYAAMIEHCDDMVGRIVDGIAAEGLTDRTMIIVTSDNGGLFRRYDFNPQADDSVADLKPLRGEKGNLYEGGIRVPLIIRGSPGLLKNRLCAEPAVTHDFYPTLAELAEARLPENQPLDGRSLVPLLSEEGRRLDRPALYWHYPHYHHGRPASCIRERDWKLIEYLDGSGQAELYQITEDIGEQNNLAAEKPGRVADLRGKLRDWRQTVTAAMPIPNPAYDPNKAGEWWSPRTGRPIDSTARRRFPQTELDPKE